MAVPQAALPAPRSASQSRPYSFGRAPCVHPNGHRTLATSASPPNLLGRHPPASLAFGGVYLRAIASAASSLPRPVEVRLEPGVAWSSGRTDRQVQRRRRAALGVWQPGSSEPPAEKPDDVLFSGRAAASPSLLPGRASCSTTRTTRLPTSWRKSPSCAAYRKAARAVPDQRDLGTPHRPRGAAGRRRSRRGGGLVISQGKVEQIWPRPEERRALVEEAAGLGKFGAAVTARS